MKKTYTTEDLSRVFAQLDELAKVERAQALQILAEIEEFLQNTDFGDDCSSYVNILIGIARFHVNAKDTNAAYAALKEALKAAEDANSSQEIFHVQSTIAIIDSMRGDHLKAIYTWEDMLENMDKSHSMWVPIVNNLIVAYSFTLQYARSVDMSYELLEVLDDSDYEPEVRISALINLGNAYRPLKSYEKALKVYKEAEEIATRQNNMPYLSYAYSNMAHSLADLGRYDEALEYNHKVLEINKVYYADAQIADALSALGNNCIRVERFDEAKEYLLQAMDLIDASEDRVGYITLNLDLGSLHQAIKEYDTCLAYLQKAEQLLEETDVVQHRITLYKLYGDCYSAMGNYQESNKYLSLLSKIQDQQYIELSEKMISKQEAEYLRRKIERQNESYHQKNIELEESNRLIKLQSQQLEESNHELHTSLGMLNRLISIISHDVRGPIANSSAALKMINDGSINLETNKDLVGYIINSLDGLNDLLTEMMIWIESRSFSKGVDRLMQDVALESMLDPVLKLYHGQIIQKQLNLEVDIAECKIPCYTEPNILKIVLRNILSNAIKFTPQGGTISITCNCTGQCPQLHIKDNGVGMSKDEVSQLLKQGLKSKAGTNQEIGMGLGLRLSLGYLKILGIDFSILSEENQGTEFVLKLRSSKTPKSKQA